MTADILQFILYAAILVALAWPLGDYMARVYQGERTLLTPVIAPVERALCALAGRNALQDQHWASYALSVLAFNLAGLLRALRHSAAPASPAVEPARPGADVARTSPSTRRSASSPTPTGRPMAAKRRCRYFSQMAGLTVQNFVSAATGMAVAAAVIRGFAGTQSKTHRQFLGRHDPRRSSTSCCRCRSSLALVLVWQGVPQTLAAYVPATTLEGASRRSPRPGRLASSPSSSSAPMAAASSTSTRRIRSRTRRRSPTSSRCCPSC